MKTLLKFNCISYSFILFFLGGFINDNNAQIAITTPTASTTWAKGQNQTIQWTSNLPAATNLRILLYRGNSLVASISNITPNDGSHTYFVPQSLPNAANYRIRILNIANPNIRTFSDFFTISDNTPFINIATPTASMIWRKGQHQSIHWTSTLPASTNLRILLYRGSSPIAPISTITSNDGLYTYFVPQSLPNGTNYRVRIFDITNPSINDFSDFFVIMNGNNNSRSFSLNNENSNEHKIEHLSISPNPPLAGVAPKVLILSNEAIKTQMIISDITGRIVHQKTVQLIKGRNDIDIIPILEKGIYIISIQAANTNKSLKLVIE